MILCFKAVVTHSTLKHMQNLKKMNIFVSSDCLIAILEAFHI